MAQRKPHISLASERLIKRVLKLNLEQFRSWPESVQELALSLAAEIFIIRYNPFIKPELVRQSVWSRLETEKNTLSSTYYQIISTCLENYWREFEQDQEFKNKLIKRLSSILPSENIGLAPNIIAECSTDATDLRMELPLMVLFPETTEQIQEITRLANEMNFALIPRGGGSGLTGGAIPGAQRSVILSMSMMKKILSIDEKDMVLCAQTGVITLDAIKAADEKGLLFTVDPASKAASSLGGNVSENAGGPFAFEYGTTLDNILSYKMVLPSGELIEVKRKDHPRHKILPDETAVFEIYNAQGKLKEVITLKGSEIRTPGLGKDVTNKYLGGLPGIQKEGVDGVITEVCFTLHPKMSLSKVLCLEFFGKSMRNAMHVIKDVVAFRDEIRRNGDLVKISALEEFGTKYVQAIDYKTKSTRYEGHPISVLILQLDSNDAQALDEAVQRIVDIATPYEGVDIFVARDEKEAEHFWEDRHKLSAITKRTSGFKINEDVVIPLEVVPEFSDFIENLNLYYLALAYRKALLKVNNLTGVDIDDEFIHMELDVTSDILKGRLTKDELPEQELELQIRFFFQDLKSRYPKLQNELEDILENLFLTRIIIANHMHAGDGNCHVNIPVNSNDREMLHLAEEAASKVFSEVLRIGGQISGEHGIGVTKIGYLAEEKIKALREYKRIVDPNNIFNPNKLTQKEIPVEPYTFSFNQLIEDIKKTAIPEKEKIINLLKDIQTCSRCGKCKQVCPMFLPQKRLLFHPRNKNITLGALIEAIYYSQLLTGEPDPELLEHLRKIMEHCTACGKCTYVCPVKINNAQVALESRSFLDSKNASGHPLKKKILHFLSQDPQQLLPKAAKVASIGQQIQNKVVGFIPASWRQKLDNPLFRGKGPTTEYKNLAEALHLEQGSVFVPDQTRVTQAVIYFPGCGAGLFYRSIGLSALYLLLKSNTAVILPPVHLCCGYPLLASGCTESYHKIAQENKKILQEIVLKNYSRGLVPSHILTSCGTCREGIKDYDLSSPSSSLVQMDVVQYLLQNLSIKPENSPQTLIYHPSCHAEWSGTNLAKAGQIYAQNLGEFLNSQVRINPGCCGESGMGALTSPEIYNRIRDQKIERLREVLPSYSQKLPILVGCPSCKIGIKRSLMELKDKHRVLHTVEFLAEQVGGPKWKTEFLKALKKGKVKDNQRVIKL